MTHRLVNNYLAALVVLLAAYIFILPFLPAVTWWVQHDAPVIGTKPATVLAADDPIPAENTLVIPKIGLRTPVHSGPDIASLNKGVWHIPDSSTPDGDGNTVMAGHRFTYGGNAIFYNLDKLTASDTLYVYWQGQRYEYIISAIRVVPPTDTSLVQQTGAPMLTIYTCTPLWSAKDRLVISAQLVMEGQ